MDSALTHQLAAHSVAASNAPPKRHLLTRRQFLGLTGVGIGAAGSLAAYARWVEPFWAKTVSVNMDFLQLPAALRGLRLVQISDLHVSNIVPTDYLRRQIAAINRLQPDVVVITGDFTTTPSETRIRTAAELVGELRAKLGVFACPGNHDYAAYGPRAPGNPISRSASSQVAFLTESLVARGVRMLRNGMSVVAVGDAKLQFVGLDDLWGGDLDPPRAFADARPHWPTIVLSHNPDTFETLKNYPFDWMLSGHTHGGQVRIPLLGAPILPIDHRQYDTGYFAAADRRLYVNQGLGFIRKVRFNCRPEITQFTLTSRSA